MLDLCEDAGLTVDRHGRRCIRSAAPKRSSARRSRDAGEQFVIVTKVFMRMGPGAHDVGLSRKHIIAACEASLRRLQTDYLDVYMSPRAGPLRAARGDTSRVRRSRPPGQGAVHRVLEPSGVARDEGAGGVGAHGLARYICQQVNYSLIARDIEHELVPLGLDQGVGVMAWSPLHFGLLSGKFRRDARPSETRLESARRARHGRSRARLSHRGRARRDRPGARRRVLPRWRSTGCSTSPASTR